MVCLFLYQHLRKKEGLHYIDLGDEEFLSDLETGKFTILVKKTTVFPQNELSLLSQDWSKDIWTLLVTLSVASLDKLAALVWILSKQIS